MSKKVVIIGAGFAGLSAASFMAKEGWEVHVFEKHEIPGGRARQLRVGEFVFDMGPSWYWMPDVFERYFKQFGKERHAYYGLERIDPSYRVYWSDEYMDVPAGSEKVMSLFESVEPGAGRKLAAFLTEAAFKYEVGIGKLVFKPGRSLLEFLDINLLKGLLKLDVLTSMEKHIRKYFTSGKLQQLLEFPVLFLGALARDTPALYSLMNYADITGGTWYPAGGMYSVVTAMHNLAVACGVHFHFSSDVQNIVIDKGIATGIECRKGQSPRQLTEKADVIIGAADYHFIEQSLLPAEYRSYSAAYWEKRMMAPSCLLYYVGLNKRLHGIRHHSLFFDTSFDRHGREIYVTKEWPLDPLFYVSATSVTDAGVAPPGCENLFLLIPVAAGIAGDTEQRRDYYFDLAIRRMERHFGQSIHDAILFKRSYAHSDFVADYNSFKGNAYGLANTLSQTAILKPACRSRKVSNLFFTGQLTVPGPGVPPSLISGEVVAKEVLRYFT